MTAPQAARHVGAGGGGALLALVLERPADHRRPQHVRVGRRVRQDEVLAAGLADQPRVGRVVRQVLPDLLPEVLERRRRAGEVDAGQVAVGQGDLGDVEPVTGDQVDDARGHPGRLQQLHGQLRGDLLRRRRLPHHRVAHQRRSGRQVAGDRGEVERRDRVDEALERAVVHAVPDALGVQRRLLLEDLPGEVDVEPPEVDQLAGGVDLGLVRGLGLTEHRCGVELLAPRAGQQLGRLEQDRGAVVEGHRAPGRGGVLGRGHRELRVVDGGVAHRAEDLAAGVGLAHVDLLATAHHPLAGDRVRELEALAAQLGQRRLELGALGTAGRVVQRGLVGGGGNVGDCIHYGGGSWGIARHGDRLYGGTYAAPHCTPRTWTPGRALVGSRPTRPRRRWSCCTG